MVHIYTFDRCHKKLKYIITSRAFKLQFAIFGFLFCSKWNSKIFKRFQNKVHFCYAFKRIFLFAVVKLIWWLDGGRTRCIFGSFVNFVAQFSPNIKMQQQQRQKKFKACATKAFKTKACPKFQNKKKPNVKSILCDKGVERRGVAERLDEGSQKLWYM